MSSLANCIKKAGKNISKADIEFLKESRQEYVDDGIKSSEASVKAIGDYVALIDSEVNNIEQEIEANGGNVERAAYSLKNDGRNSKRWRSVVREKGAPHYRSTDYYLEPLAELETDNDFSEKEHRLDLGHASHVDEGNEAWSFRVVDASGTAIATLLAQVDPKTDEITAIHDIDVANQGQGVGSLIVSDILANSQKPVKIIEMIDQAWSFWQKMGVESRDQYKNGEVSWKGYLRKKHSGKRQRSTQGENVGVGEQQASEQNSSDLSRANESITLDSNQEAGIEDGWFYRLRPEPDNLNPVVKWYDSAIRYFQDKYISLKRTQQAIEKISDISDESNTYEKETLMHGKAQEDLKAFENDQIEPLMAYLAENNIEPEELDLYLYAKHAEERNAHISDNVNDEVTSGSGMTDSEAQAILNAFSDRTPSMEMAAFKVYEMLKYKRELLHTHGLLTDLENDSWASDYQFYVPLKGFATDEAGFTKGFFEKLKTFDFFKTKQVKNNQIIGKGFAIKGKESMKALGRRTTAGSILSHTFADVSAAILRSRKNEVAQSFLSLVEDNPDSTYWNVYTARNRASKRSSQTGKPVFMTEYEMANSDEFVPVKRNGIQYYIKVNDPDLVAAMRNLGTEKTGRVIRAMGAVNRYLSTMSTSLSPDFVVSNFFRDMQTGLFNALGEMTREDGKLRAGDPKDFLNLKKIQKSYRGAMSSIWHMQRGNEPREGNEWDSAYAEFLKSGAKTGFFDSKTIEEEARAMRNMIESYNGTAKGRAIKYSKAVLKVVEDLNTTVENATRLLAFKYARDVGLTTQKAAVFAKDLTVNFNRRGNASTGLNAFYMFANASVQGNANFIRSMGSSPIRVDPVTGEKRFMLTGAQAAGAAMATAGFLMSMLARESGGEDDDGEDWIDKVPDYITERNMVFFTPEKMFSRKFMDEHSGWFGKVGERGYIKIPLPYGYNVFHNLGSGAEQLANGSKRKNKTWFAKYLTFSVLGSFSPIGTANSPEFESGVVKTITPTVGKPFVDMALNENFFGSPIYTDRRFINPETPDSSIPKRGTWDGWKSIAKTINEITLGDEYSKGGIDIAAESFEYLFKYATGGFGTFINNLAATGDAVKSGEPVDVRKVPIARKVLGKTSAYQNTNDFYTRSDELNMVRKQWLDLPYSQKTAFLKENREKIQLAKLARDYHGEIKKLRKLIRKLESKKTLTNYEKNMLEKAEKRETKLITDFNLRYNKL